jgi:hypothetical protein
MLTVQTQDILLKISECVNQILREIGQTPPALGASAPPAQKDLSMSIITLSCGSQGKKQQTEFEQIIPEAEKIVSLSRNQNPKLMTVRRVILCLRRKGFYASCTAFSPYFVYERWRCNRQGFVANLWLLNAGAHGARRGDGVGLRTTGRLALALLL